MPDTSESAFPPPEWPPEVLVGHEYENFDPPPNVYYDYPRKVSENGVLDLTSRPWYSEVFRAPQWDAMGIRTKDGWRNATPAEEQWTRRLTWVSRVPIMPFALVFLAGDRVLRWAGVLPPMVEGFRRATPMEISQMIVLQLAVQHSRLTLFNDGVILLGVEQKPYLGVRLHHRAAQALICKINRHAPSFVWCKDDDESQRCKLEVERMPLGGIVLNAVKL